MAHLCSRGANHLRRCPNGAPQVLQHLRHLRVLLRPLALRLRSRLTGLLAANPRYARPCKAQAASSTSHETFAFASSWHMYAPLLLPAAVAAAFAIAALGTMAPAGLPLPRAGLVSCVSQPPQ